MIREELPVDDLNAPLGNHTQEKQQSSPLFVRWRMIAAAAAVLLLGAAAGALLANYPLRQAAAPKVGVPENAGAERTGSLGENRPVEVIRPEAAAPAPPAQPDKTESPATQTITIIDGTSGKREQIVVPAKPQATR